MNGERELVLQNDDVSLVVLPGHGGDLHSLTHRASGVDVLYKPGWPPSGVTAIGGARADWLADYRGGWQVLLPNGGDRCERGGQAWGFHGEASTVPWAVDTADDTRAELTVQLTSAPLRVRRTLTLDGPTLRLAEVVENPGSDATDIMYVHHPAFGLPLLGPGARLDTGARTVVTDPVAAGDVATPEQRSRWPRLPAPEGDVDLRELPDASRPRALLAYLTDFSEPYCAITNPGLGLGVAVRWSPAPFPHAWLWQEVHGTPEPPWRGREHVVAVEPASTFPAAGLTAAEERGGHGIVLAGGSRIDAVIEMTLFAPPADFVEVTGVSWGGRVHF